MNFDKKKTYIFDKNTAIKNNEIINNPVINNKWVDLANGKEVRIISDFYGKILLKELNNMYITVYPNQCKIAEQK